MRIAVRPEWMQCCDSRWRRRGLLRAWYWHLCDFVHLIQKGHITYILARDCRRRCSWVWSSPNIQVVLQIDEWPLITDHIWWSTHYPQVVAMVKAADKAVTSTFVDTKLVMLPKNWVSWVQALRFRPQWPATVCWRICHASWPGESPTGLGAEEWELLDLFRCQVDASVFFWGGLSYCKVNTNTLNSR